MMQSEKSDGPLELSVNDMAFLTIFRYDDNAVKLGRPVWLGQPTFHDLRAERHRPADPWIYLLCWVLSILRILSGDSGGDLVKSDTFQLMLE